MSQSFPKSEFRGIIAQHYLWEGLGAAVQPYTNAPGRVGWGYLRSDEPSERYALELLGRARAALPHAHPETDGDAIVTKAIELRDKDRAARSLAKLGASLSQLAERGVTFSGAVAAQIDHVVRQVAPALGDAAS